MKSSFDNVISFMFDLAALLCIIVISVVIYFMVLSVSTTLLELR